MASVYKWSTPTWRITLRWGDEIELMGRLWSCENLLTMLTSLIIEAMLR
ncbi:MAG: hypothetical protein K8L91_01255 [Anaerolineae bacterium]|nr:hypothetical protein [Anaerolineae bacterium]